MKTLRFIYYFIILWFPTKLAIKNGEVKKSTTLGDYIRAIKLFSEEVHNG